ncbi:efflux RND transporter periplasmic adaptor subunit [Herbaspirillum chlorophenolicum]|uniref:efflux RND transporter periplasmic adaptor subunit n=1 Tax=Herbaspirillum chlorophenolicum TaxID=211589 RepID=UPI00067C270A|nr:efflux RND transporter periplasmic adaptor subunit [Herbaspirillum chlorophenolicum]
MDKKQKLAIAAILIVTALAAGAITLGGKSGSDEHGDHGKEDTHTEHKEAGHKENDDGHAAGKSAKAGDAHGDDAHDEGERIAFSAEQMRVAGIVLADAGLSDMTGTLPLPGEIRFDADRTAHVVPRVAGVVEAAPVRLGQAVKKGQLLAIIDSGAISDLRSEAQNVQQRLALARDGYAREKKLWEEKISAEQDYLQARAALREAEIAARNAAQKLAALGAGGDGSSGAFQIRAPFDGVVVEKHIALGEMVKEDTAVFTLSDLSQVWAEIDVPASALDAVRVGAAATVKASALSSSASGKVAYVGALLGEQTRTAKAHVVLPNPGGAWRPGMFVTVEVAAGAARQVLAVPDDAVHTVENRSVVFTAAEGGFIAQPVKTGRSQDGRTEILSGLEPGQRYAARNAFLVKAELGKASAEHAH